MPTYSRSDLQIQRSPLSILSGNQAEIFSNTPYAVANQAVSIGVMVDLPAGKEVKEVKVLSKTVTKKYVEVDFILQANSSYTQRGIEHFSVNVPAQFRDQMDNFLFKIDGEKKKVVAANT